MPASRWIDAALRGVPERPSRRDRVAFALTFLGCAALLVVGLHASGRHVASAAVLVFGAAGAGVSLLPWVGPAFRRAWLLLGVVLGHVTSPIVLGAVFFCVVTPLALLRRRFGPDPMRRRWEEDGTYWEEYADPVDPRRYYRQF